MSHRHIFVIHLAGRGGFFGFSEMGHDLVTVEIEIDPLLGFPARGATQETRVEMPSFFQVVHREGEMKRLYLTHAQSLAFRNFS